MFILVFVFGIVIDRMGGMIMFFLVSLVNVFLM